MKKVGPNVDVGAKPLPLHRRRRRTGGVRIEVRVAVLAGTRHERLEPLADELPVRLHPTALRKGRLGFIIYSGEGADRISILSALFVGGRYLGGLGQLRSSRQRQ